MSFPITISFGEINLQLHLLFETLAFFVGFRYYLHLRKKQKDVINDQNRTWIIIGAVAGALLGSRLLGGLENPVLFFSFEQSFWYYYGNKTILGGLLGGLFGVEMVKKLIHEKQSSGDMFTFPLIFAILIGRIGCFTMGVYENTYGIETDFILGMDLGDGLKRHPVVVYEMLFLLILWFFMYFLEKKLTLKSGLRFQFFMIFYCLFRVLMDFIKPTHELMFGLSAIQWGSILGLLYYFKTIKNLLFHQNKIFVKK